ncbi:MAG: flagellar hook capping protein [Lachnospiraceae bacterium]|nr:flagellar hook capping protein [Lachnospiraceae bacterium]
MAVGAIIQDGKVLETASQSSVQKAATTNNGMDKDAFLQLLVAQMKYQDPLQPTSNTEYISQYATFSQVEQMQNMSATMELSRASSMVGQLVEVQSTDSNGETKSLQGKVDYVSYENNKAYVSIDGVLYSADDVVAVVDQEYQNAYDLAVSFATAINKLPSLENLTVEDRETIEALQEGFNSMTSYQQSFIANDYIEALQIYVERMAALVEAAEESQAATENVEGTESSESVENVEETGGVAEEGTEGESVTEENIAEDGTAEDTEV